MYVIMSFISFGVIEQQVQVHKINNGESEVVDFAYATLGELGEAFQILSERYDTKYISLPLNPDIEEELVQTYGFIIFEEEQEN